MGTATIFLRVGFGVSTHYILSQLRVEFRSCGRF